MIEFNAQNIPDCRNRGEIEQFFGVIMPASIQWWWHSFTSPIVIVEGDRAEANWVLYALGVLKSAPDAAPYKAYGHHIDQYRRTPEGWRISHQFTMNETRAVDR